MQTIHIPEPCHENWAEMTPTQKGAFCGKCAINVVDFSKMENEEVRDFLFQNKGTHICGRFSNEQLYEINSEEEWFKNRTVKAYMSKFLCALLIGFGITLFNGLNAQTKSNIEYMTLGKVAYIPPIQEDTVKAEIFVDTAKTSPSDESILSLELPEDQYEPMIYGGFYVPEIIDSTSVSDTNKTSAITEPDPEPEFLMGDIYIPEEEIRMTKGEIIFQPDSSENKTNQDSLTQPKEIIKPRYTIQQVKPGPLQSTRLEIDPLPLINPHYSALLYPNPTSSESVVVINNELTQNFEILLFSSDGKLIKNLFNGTCNSGESRFPIDLKPQATGIYYVQIITSNGIETLKIQKIE